MIVIEQEQKNFAILLFFGLALSMAVLVSAEDLSSLNYQMRTAVGDPGTGKSSSANYVYEHGTWWVSAAEGQSTQLPLPPPLSDRGASVSAGSGSGLSRIEENIGGVAPQYELPLVDEVVRQVPARNIAAPKKIAREVVNRVITEEKSASQIIHVVDDDQVVREAFIVVPVTIFPWPLWFALGSITGGIGFGAWGMARRNAPRRGHYLWIALILMAGGIGIGLTTRTWYRLTASVFDVAQPTFAQEVPRAEFTQKTNQIIVAKQAGVHRITALNDNKEPEARVTIIVKTKLPI